MSYGWAAAKASVAATAAVATRFGNMTAADKVLPDMVHLIDPYWYQFEPLNELWHGILGFVMVIFTLVSIAGNFVVISIFMSTSSLRTPANLFVVNLAFSDFLMMLTMGPAMIINCWHMTWVFGPFLCEIYGMLGSLFGCASIWTMVMIAIDRYTVIVKGLSAKPLNTSGAMMRILFVWFFSAMWTVIPLFGWNRYVPEGNYTACGLDYLNQDWSSASYIVVYGAFVYFLPLFLIIYCYFFIVQAVFEHEQHMRDQAKKMNVASLRSGEAQKTSAEFKLAKIALMTISLWFMAWTPYLIINFTGIFGAAKISPLGSIWGSVFAKCMALYNPIVYGISHPKYRQALAKQYPGLSCQGGSNDDDSEAVSRGSAVTCAVIEEKPSA